MEGKGECDAVLIGFESCGKSLLMRRLNNLKGEIDPFTMSTNGIEMSSFVYDKLIFELREAGASMIPSWEQLTSNSLTTIFVIDAEDAGRFPDALLELRALLCRKPSPILAVVNKCDSPMAAPTSSVMSFFGFKKLVKEHQRFEWLFVSALTGMNCSSVAKWIATKAKGLGLGSKKRKTIGCC
eukprot:TRINITY_DN3443_c0_g1_i4.p1 TRINITY_DN3443_c0_g1~~TRINITY_DN3443_c0_g1_i4.p1  ORF type:complete len:183 (+),score=41.04 TRINITY_DN3443_c0_g1_i4:142-690(+)